MKEFGESELVRGLSEVTDLMYQHGWNERNGGNISIMLTNEELISFGLGDHVKRKIKMQVPMKKADGEIFLVTGTGKYLRNVKKDPENNVGIVRITDSGTAMEVLWGFEDGGTPTSEFPTHIMNHLMRREVDREHRVVIHCHPVNTIAMTFVHPLNDKEFTVSLWKTITECVLVFGDGVGVVPWMAAGTAEIAGKTAEKLKDCRVVIWGQHGIFAAEHTLEEAFGLIETVEKGAEIYMKTFGLPVMNKISNQQLSEVAAVYGVKIKEEYLRTF